MQEDEKFSDDPAENIKMENEFLKIKLKARYGDAFFMQSNGDLPPEIENQFLKNMMAFEDAHANASFTTVYECIGKPDYKPASNLNDTEIAMELERVNTILAEHNMALDICDGPYPDRLIYTFITEELFAHETETGGIKGMGCHFIYEEFHPNHKAEITKCTHQFLQHWFTRNFDEYSTEVSRDIITFDGRQMSKEELLDKMQLFFNAFQQFKDDAYNIDKAVFEIKEETQTGMGYAEGMLKYDALLEKGESVHYEGAYKLYLQMEHNYWNIFYFVMPGFKW
jgi:hypothetical protein